MSREQKPHLIVSLNVSDQDGQVLNTKIGIIIYMLVDTLVGWSRISIKKEEENKILLIKLVLRLNTSITHLSSCIKYTDNSTGHIYINS